jgi:hypothetical protein
MQFHVMQCVYFLVKTFNDKKPPAGVVPLFISQLDTGRFIACNCRQCVGRAAHTLMKLKQSGYPNNKSTAL